jgi:hypothetical protein
LRLETDKKLKLYSIWSFQRKDESHEVVFSEWNVTANVDSVRPSRHHVITSVSHLLDAAVVSCFGQVIVLEASQLHTAYTSIVEPSKVEFSDIKVCVHPTEIPFFVYQSRSCDIQFVRYRVPMTLLA